MFIYIYIYVHITTNPRLSAVMFTKPAILKPFTLYCKGNCKQMCPAARWMEVVEDAEKCTVPGLGRYQGGPRPF